MKRRDFIKTAGAIGGVLASSNLFATSHIKRIDSVGLMAFSTKGEFAKTNFTRHAIGDNDILIDILYADTFSWGWPRPNIRLFQTLILMNVSALSCCK